MTGFLTLHANPTLALHAATKQYVDAIDLTTRVAKSGDTMTGNLTMSGFKVSGLAAATVNGDAVRYDEYSTHNHDSLYVNVGGDTMTDFLTLHANPTLALHAATKQYVDAAVSGGGGGVAEPLYYIVHGTGTGVDSSSKFTHNTANGGLLFNYAATAYTSPGHIELYAANTSFNNAAAQGGRVYVAAGDCNVGEGFGGLIDIRAGNGVNGTVVPFVWGGSGGRLDVAAGNGQYGGNVNITAGNGSGYGYGGSLTISSGAGDVDAGGGQLSLIAGGGGYTGDATLKCNPVIGVSGNRGGFTYIQAGSTTQTGRGGIVTLEGGDTTTDVAYKKGGRFFVTEGGETLTGTPVSTASATISTVKEHIQTSLETNPFSVGFPDVSLVSCARRFVVAAYVGGAVVHTAPVQIPGSAIWAFRAQVALSGLASGVNAAGYEITGVLINNGGTVTIQNPVTTTLYATAGAATWTPVASADDVNKTLVITINTGATWVARSITIDVSQAR